MRKATSADKNNIIDIIANSFEDNLSVSWIIKNDHKRKQRIRVLAEYAFNTVLRKKGIYLSSDEKGVIMFYKQNEHKETILDYIDQAKLAIRAVGLARVRKIMAREAQKAQKRPADGEFIYCWFYGVIDSARGRGAAIELKNVIFEQADKLKLPILLETSMKKNFVAYQRYGFTVYDTWEENEKKLWFMKRMPL